MLKSQYIIGKEKGITGTAKITFLTKEEER